MDLRGEGTPIEHRMCIDDHVQASSGHVTCSECVPYRERHRVVPWGAVGMHRLSDADDRRSVTEIPFVGDQPIPSWVLTIERHGAACEPGVPIPGPTGIEPEHGSRSGTVVIVFIEHPDATIGLASVDQWRLIGDQRVLEDSLNHPQLDQR